MTFQNNTYHFPIFEVLAMYRYFVLFTQSCSGNMVHAKRKPWCKNSHSMTALCENG